MNRRSSWALGVLFTVFTALVATGCAGKAKSEPTIGGNGPAAAAASPVGSWREFWGVPGETDVTYHDEYRVWMEGGEAHAAPMNQEHPDEIQSVRIDGDNLDIVIHTSFDVHYQLRLEPGGAALTGTATTPDKTVPIRWERID
jgi:hypothetical protein